MTIKFTNNATTTLAAGINSSVTSLTVATGTGSLFPTLSGSDVFYVTLANLSGTVEIVKVTARSGDTFTIVRAQDNTSAYSWSLGDKVELRPVAAAMAAMVQTTDIGSTVQGYDAATVKTNVTQAFTKPQSITPQAMTSGSAIDASTYQAWAATVNGSSFTVTNPTGGITGCYYALYVSYTTSHTLSWGANFKGISGITPTATAGAEDHMVFRFDGTYYECVGYALNIKA